MYKMQYTIMYSTVKLICVNTVEICIYSVYVHLKLVLFRSFRFHLKHLYILPGITLHYRCLHNEKKQNRLLCVIGVNSFCYLIVYYKFTSQLTYDTIVLVKRKSHNQIWKQVQCNFSKPNTLGTKEMVQFREVSGLKRFCMYS